MRADAAKRFEVIIIGAGPAGLSAGLVLGRCIRRALICDDERYRNKSSHALHCFLGQDGISPSDLLKRSRDQLRCYPTLSFTAATANEIRSSNGEFIVDFKDGSSHRAKAVLVATGMVDELPNVKGIEAFFGRSVHVCPYCDAWEHRNAPVAVYGSECAGGSLRARREGMHFCAPSASMDPRPRPLYGWGRLGRQTYSPTESTRHFARDGTH